MIYVFANDDRTLTAYRTEAEAIAACECIDVEGGNYRFYSAAGEPLSAVILDASRRGRFTVVDGRYKLVPATVRQHPGLLQVLDEVSGVEGCGLTSTAEVAESVKVVLAAKTDAPSNNSLDGARGGQ